MRPLSAKEYVFLFIITLSVLSFCLVLSLFLNIWLLLVILFIHICVVIFLASFAKNTWISLFFPVVWLICDFFVEFFIPLSLLVGLPMMFLFFAVRRNFALRIKIDYQNSVRPALTQTFIISVLILSIFIGFKTTNDQIKNITIQSINLMGNIEVAGEKLNPNTTFDQLIGQQSESVLEQCKGNASCEANVTTQIKNEIFNQLGIDSSANIGSQTVLEYQVNKFFDKYVNYSFSVLFAAVVFVVLSPFALLFSVAIGLFSSILFIILRLSFVLRVQKIMVEQEVLV